MYFIPDSKTKYKYPVIVSNNGTINLFTSSLNVSASNESRHKKPTISVTPLSFAFLIGNTKDEEYSFL